MPLTAIGGDAVRAAVRLAPQDAYLFTTTLRDNVALGRAGAGDGEIYAALEAVGLGPWLDSLPEGLDTEVGEAGARVSGGQRQRIAAARLFLARAALPVFDEPTAHLDPDGRRRPAAPPRRPRRAHDAPASSSSPTSAPRSTPSTRCSSCAAAGSPLPERRRPASAGAVPSTPRAGCGRGRDGRGAGDVRGTPGRREGDAWEASQGREVRHRDGRFVTEMRGSSPGRADHHWDVGSDPVSPPVGSLPWRLTVSMRQ